MKRVNNTSRQNPHQWGSLYSAKRNKNETKQIETKQIETKRNKSKRNETNCMERQISIYVIK